MMKRTLSFLFALFISLFLFGQAVEKFHFQGNIVNLNNQQSNSQEIDVKIQIINDTESVLYEEQHRTVCNDNGTFNLIIGEGNRKTGSFSSINWREPLRLSVFLKNSSDTDWINAGSSRIEAVPFAEYANTATTATDALALQRLLVPGNFSIISASNDTILYFDKMAKTGIHQGRITIDDDFVDAQLKPNQSLTFSTTREDGDTLGCISFHWTILESKPAIVMYDENYRRHFAAVAHYWSHSGRAHQHISFEVDEDSTEAVQTRFAFPWGNKLCDMRVFGHFKINYPGSLIVGTPEDATPAFFGDDVFALKNIRLGDKDSYVASENTPLQVSSRDKGVGVALTQESDSYESRIVLHNSLHKWELVNHREFQLERDDKKVFTLYRNGYSKVGTTDPNYDLDITGNALSNSLLTATSGVQKAIEKDSLTASLQIGDLVGMDYSTGRFCKYENNKHLTGIVLDANETTFYMCTMGQVFVSSAQYTVTNGIAYTLYGDEIGPMLSNNKIFFKLK